MNVYQKAALGSFIVLMMGLLMVVVYGLGGIIVLTAIAFTGYLLTLKTVRRLMWATVMVVGLIIGDIGSFVGRLGDKVAVACAHRCGKLEALSMKSQRGYVPEWEELTPSQDDSQELEFPGTSDETERQYT